MTLATLRTRVREYLEVGGKPVIQSHPTVGTGFDARISEGLQALSRESYGLYVSRKTFTLPSGSSGRTLEQLGMVEVIQVSGSAGVLRDHGGKPGPVRAEDIEVKRRAAVASANPTRWALVGSDVLFDTAPASDWTGAVAGYKLHGAVSADGDTVEFLDADADAVAAYVAGFFITPTTATEAGMNRRGFLKSISDLLVERLAGTAFACHGVMAPGLRKPNEGTKP